MADIETFEPDGRAIPYAEEPPATNENFTSVRSCLRAGTGHRVGIQNSLAGLTTYRAYRIHLHTVLYQ
mgnify:CR=1 FL=1